MSPQWARQQGFGVRVEWGRAGAAAIGDGAACVVVIDVLSFTTSVSLATAAGTAVYPYRWRDESARAFADEHRAALAVGRREAGPRAPWSLSPAAIRRAPFTERLVLPSPNGSAIATTVREARVVAASLRNVGAVAAWLADQDDWGHPDRPIAVVAAGEQWPGTDIVRPAIEDWLGAGALVAALRDAGLTTLSPEAEAAASTFRGTPAVGALITDSASGRELTAIGFADDVALAVELDADRTVPLLTDGAFVDAARLPRNPPRVSHAPTPP
ncbi:2-phosphosulfolactate phosphatase [Nocardia sp. AG03]|uniref:2-phosphosulfolactate phosphatase n=1 Tax=Nocardia sp. AG03 TaxID=3025312 RepID=UPI0024183611|nr:2-phosphosulfolactate phosphatase [Nocardia sp. AG03]